LSTLESFHSSKPNESAFSVVQNDKISKSEQKNNLDEVSNMLMDVKLEKEGDDQSITVSIEEKEVDGKF
jgi:hypothetical protein